MNAARSIPQSKFMGSASALYWARLGLTLVFVAFAFLATLSLQHLFPYPFLFLFFGAVMAGAWFGGYGCRTARGSVVDRSCRVLLCAAAFIRSQ